MESKATSDAPPEAERLEGGTGKNLRGGIAEGGREEEEGGAGGKDMWTEAVAPVQEKC